MRTHRAIVVGGGLAGLTAAKVLVEHGVEVTVLEADRRLGGKAGSTWFDDGGGARWEDHGFHVFPAWYLNTRALMRDAGCDRHLVDMHEFHFLQRGEFPRFHTTREFTGPRNLLHNLRAGPLSFWDALLSYYAVLELAAKPRGSRRYLDQVSTAGFLWSRPYMSEKIVEFHHQNVLQAAAVPFYECSSMTLRNLFRMWLATPTPLYSILAGSLEEKLIQPLRRYLEQRGVQVITGVKVDELETRDGRVAGLRLSGPDAIEPAPAADTLFVLAVPHAEALRLVDEDALRVEWEQAERDRRNHDLGPETPALAKLANLRSAPMSAWHVRLKRKVAGFPKSHFNLVGSRFALTLCDISQHWDLPTTTLNVVSANFHPLRCLGEEQQKRFLRDELVAYIPELEHDFPNDLGLLQTHLDNQLFLNTAGAWHFRPAAETGVSNLFLAGDYCRTPADLTTMESAVMSGVLAAKAVLRRAGVGAEVELITPPEPSTWLLQLLRLGALPIIAPLALKRWIERKRLDHGQPRPSS